LRTAITTMNSSVAKGIDTAGYTVFALTGTNRHFEGAMAGTLTVFVTSISSATTGSLFLSADLEGNKPITELVIQPILPGRTTATSGSLVAQLNFLMPRIPAGPVDTRQFLTASEQTDGSWMENVFVNIKTTVGTCTGSHVMLTMEAPV
jgi:hypothetical protein